MVRERAYERAVLAFECGYRVCPEGGVRSPLGTQVRTFVGARLRFFTIRSGGRRHTVYVHLLWLVSQVGVDASLQGVGVVFKDGDQSNCVRGNLLVVRRAVQRRRIVALRHMGYTYGQIAQEVGVDRRMCWRMCQVS